MFVIHFQKPLGSPCRNGENAFSDGSDFYAVPEVSVKDGKPSRSVEKSASKSTADSAKGAEAVEQKKSKELELKEFDIPELDCIFNDFKTSFDPFVQNRQDLENSEDSFKNPSFYALTFLAMTKSVIDSEIMYIMMSQMPNSTQIPQ